MANTSSSGKSKNAIESLTISPSQQPAELTTLQTRLKRKLGDNSYPLFFKIPKGCPCSVTLQPAAGDTGKPCGIDYELKTWILEPHGFENTINSPISGPNGHSAENEAKPSRINDMLPVNYNDNNNNNKNHTNNENNKNGNANNDENSTKNVQKGSVVKLAIRKIQYAPALRGPQPQAEVKQSFLFNDKQLNLEATLDKELYHHGEKIFVNVQIQNNSKYTVKKIKVTVRQFTDICLYSNAQYKCVVASAEKDHEVKPSQAFCWVYEVCPLLSFKGLGFFWSCRIFNWSEKS